MYGNNMYNQGYPGGQGMGAYDMQYGNQRYQNSYQQPYQQQQQQYHSPYRYAQAGNYSGSGMQSNYNQGGNNWWKNIIIFVNKNSSINEIYD